MFPVESPFKVYTGRDGKPLNNGYVYFGVANQNPVTAPITVYWDLAGTQPALQPLRTENGYIVHAGTPANVFCDVDYSELVNDSRGRRVFYARTSADFSVVSALLAFIALLASSVGTSLVGFIQAGVGAILRTGQAKLRERVSIEDFGGVGDGVTNCTEALLNAIASLRANAVSIDNGISSPSEMVTSYSSGVVELGLGTFLIDPDEISITQDMGLTLKGKGSRGANNSVRAATTILVSGTSSGFGIQSKGNGARNFRIQGLDICYASAGFTGDLLDIYGAPGTKLTDVFLGTNGLTGGTRLKTARSLLRATYDEFLSAINCVLDGAVDMIWFDNSRGPFEFGGSMTKLDNVVFYDCTGTMILQDATRSRRGLQLNNVSFNPIDVAGVRAIDLGNVQGVTINGGIAIGSVGHAPTVEWMRLLNCTGHVHGFGFGDYSKAGTFGGFLDLSNNVVDTTDGFTASYGVISGKGNRFRFSSSGWLVTGSPATELVLDLGPDLFAADVGNSYNIASVSDAISGHISYSKEHDLSTSRWTNDSPGVTVENIDKRYVTVTAATYSISIHDTGRMIVADGAVAQEFTVPAPVHGVLFDISTKAQDFTLVTSAGYPFYTGTGGVKTSLDKVAADVGCSLELRANGTDGWLVQKFGTWTEV